MQKWLLLIGLLVGFLAGSASQAAGPFSDPIGASSRTSEVASRFALGNDRGRLLPAFDSSRPFQAPPARHGGTGLLPDSDLDYSKSSHFLLQVG
jgi:hypothetical protein